ncbi:hypothetical protein SPBR_07217 [Sporothrix brasiliensis 5110]|uniref:Ring-like domain-containing protein n=1 Tax=Sporothrix brasiliensis 5110 TaxID=1398154 RepID=A0A0C2IPN0_9PEZI|nr:uncharacterized protein SPBR_07217 [Sporothrix brasiliensis 5110]KIH88890.1 hypothetical protein SPBR_07217 [Sporothrix brasiliensis 5110]
MLEYLNTKKSRKPVPESASSSASPQEAPTKPPRPTSTGPVEDVPVLDRDEQSFLENLTLNWGPSDNEDNYADGDDDGTGERPPLPPRIKTPDLTWDSDSESFVRGERLVAVDNDVLMPTEARDKGSSGVVSGGISGVGRRLSTLFSSKKGKDKDRPHPAHLVVPGKVDVDADAASSNSQLAAAVTPTEEDRERADLARVLDDLDLGKDGQDNKDNKDGTPRGKQSKANKFAVSLSAESAELVRRFVLVLKDLVNGVPTAADDLKSLLDDRDGALARGFERLPSSLRKLVSQLPGKLTSSLAPELMAAAAASQGVAYEAEKEGVTAKGAAKTMLLPLLTKPNAIVKMLKAIMNALKLRWPAFIGTSAIWSVALFLLLFVLWYCHKRGREVRLGKEASDAAAGPSNTEAPGGAETAGTPEPPIVIDKVSPKEEAAAASGLPRPPIGPDAPKSK